MASFAEYFRELDNARKARFEALQSRNLEELTPAEISQSKMAPIRQDKVFLLSIGEPFFETVYPALQELQKRNHPQIHFGLGGTRNFSIIGATKADAAILVDFNISQQELIECLGDTARELIRDKGIGNFGPKDFVALFSENEKANALLAKIPHDPAAHSKIETTLEPDLQEPESWLYEHQTDGRFDHVMRLFSEDKIATLVMNAVDRQGFEETAEVVERIKREIPELEGAETGSVFLTNVPYFLGKSEGFGAKDQTPRDSLFLMMNNVQIFGNPYVVCAKERVFSWKSHLQDTLRGQISQELRPDKINGPITSQIDHYNAVHWRGDRVELRQVSVGGYLDTMTRCFHAIDDKFRSIKERSTPIYGSSTEREHRRAAERKATSRQL